VPKEFFVANRFYRWGFAKPARWIPMGKGVFFLWTGRDTLAIRYAPFRGYKVVARWSGRRPPGAAPRHAPERYEETTVKKVKLAERSAVKHLAALDCKMFQEHRAVLEAVAMLSYEDGSPREGGYLGTWVQGGTWFLRVQDKTGDAQMTAEGRTLEEAYDTLQVLLTSENPPWEPISRRKAKGGQKSS